MIKLKIFTIVIIAGLLAAILNSSHQFSSFAESDAADEIANYKTWTRVTKEPVKVEINMAAVSG